MVLLPFSLVLLGASRGAKLMPQESFSDQAELGAAATAAFCTRLHGKELLSTRAHKFAKIPRAASKE